MCKYFLALALVCLGFIASQIAYAITPNPIIKIEEKNVELVIENNTSKVNLKIENTLNKTIIASVLIELVDPENQVQANLTRYEKLSPGLNSLSLNFPDSTAELIKKSDILWYRLRYTVATELTSKADSKCYQGTISLSELLRNVFELQVIASEYTLEGSRYQAKVLALHPVSNKPISNVNVTGEITIENPKNDTEEVLKATAITAFDGQAILYFDIPKKLETNEFDLKIKGQIGGFSQETSHEVRLNAFTYISINTDKPIYQPDQDLNIRLLFFNMGRKAIVDELLTLKVNDPEGNTLFRTQLKTSRFGAANTIWHIPASSRLGDYSIEVELENEKYQNRRASQEVKISRYDLPNFSVTAKPDQSYYLLGQTAKVTVSADYLFGKPVQKGKVRVVKESERHWNYSEQKLEVTEDEVFEGTLDAKGQFIITIALTEDEDELDYYIKYKDFNFVAYVTDQSTNRTEQKRFDIRVSKYQIHIYTRNETYNTNLPMEFYLSSFYADGVAAQCDISLYEVEEPKTEDDQDDKNAIPKIVGEPLLTVTTNSYGVAKVNSLKLAEYYRTHDKSKLVFFAKDKSNHTGLREASFYIENRDIINISTNKTIYRHGEPIEVEISASKQDMSLMVDVVKNLVVIESRQINLEAGKASFPISYNEQFQNTVTISAYPILSSENNYNFPSAYHNVIYPKDKDLKLTVALDKETYKPGEEAKAKLQVKNAAGEAKESLLGITVIDKAVEERARTEQEFGKHSFYQAYNYLSNESENIGEITLRDIRSLDLSKPIPLGLDLVAEMLLADYSYRPEIDRTSYFKDNYNGLFNKVIESDLAPIKETLTTSYSKLSSYPTDEITFKSLLGYFEPYFYRLQDPWGTSYKVSFFTENDLSTMKIFSAGADKTFGTSDDFVALNMGWPYFRPYGELLNRIANEYHFRTKKYIQDLDTLKAEFLKKGVNLDELQDPYGKPYSFDFQIERKNFTIKVISKGSPDSYQFYVWTTSINYFAEFQEQIQKELDKNLEATGDFPKNELEFLEVLKKTNLGFSQAGIIPSIIQDRYSNIYDVKFSTRTTYNEKPQLTTYSKFGEETKSKTQVLSIKSQTKIISIISRGEDHISGTYDDFEIAFFSYNETLPIIEVKQDSSQVSFFSVPTNLGRITGLVTDETGAVIAGTLIKVTNKANGFSYTVTTNENGTFIIENLPEGSYEVMASADGFLKSVVDEVVVKGARETTVNFAMKAGGAMDIVTVSGNAVVVERDTSSIAEVKKVLLPANNFVQSVIPAQQISTPRLREYFPETLFWQPELETTPEGQANIKFKLADNITSWKMSVIGSTVDGELGIAETEFLAFQPFFVDIDPPTRLTEGDEISLPIILRSYLDRTQSVMMEIASQNWFTAKSPLKKQFEIISGSFVRELFRFRAERPINKGNQVVSVVGTDASDAIRRTIDVFPDGQEVVDTFGKVVNNSASFDISCPANTLKSGHSLELKVYPNLLAHLLESVEAILLRPYGCGEQTISSAYPSLLLLKYLKQNNKSMPTMELKARRYLQLGYDRLLNYQNSSGAFTYWGRDSEPDIALTAYAIRFLVDAKTLINVNEEQIKVACNWLLVQQNLDGSWAPKYWYSENKEQKALLTANVALALTRANSDNNEEITKSIKHALDYLSKYSREDTQVTPYLLACISQINIKLGEKETTAQINSKLRRLTHKESSGNYWTINNNTPFYSWGLAERIETTSLVVQALSQEQNSISASLSDESINQGLLFLLSNKDRYGIWYSTQTTVNVLETLLTIVSQQEASKKLTNEKAEIYINDKLIKTLELPPSNEPAALISTDLSEFITNGSAKVEVRNIQGSAQIVNTYYLPWLEKFGKINSPTPVDSGTGAKELAFSVSFDKTQAKVGEEITCSINAARIGKNHYGMLLAEIGLPPGADVDRESLEKAMTELGWSFSRYDILPDRLIVYLWPWKDGVSFSFKFHQRFGLKALNARSIMYDYYNPDSKTVLAPIQFSIEEEAK